MQDSDQTRPTSVADATARLTTALAGRFAIRRELGAGGMATVYLTEDLKHHRSVAVKVLRPELAMALGRDRFLREIEIIAHLTHPHILPLHDSGVVDDVYYFVMPYVQGESLRDKLEREGQLPIDEALQISREVADALAYAHSHGVIHRDIKPHNIMLEAGHAFVTDFGIAHLAHMAPGSKLTDTAVSLGTPQYMSPEQVGGARHIDGRSDIYSLGCVLHEMLTGQPPFTGPSAYAIMARHATEVTPDVRIVRPTVSASLAHVLATALAKVPADRYRNAQEFAHAIDQVAHEQAAVHRVVHAPDNSRGSRVPIASETAPPRGGAELADAPERAISRAYQAVLAIVGAVVVLSLIGFVSTLFYDSVLQVPVQFRPTRSDFPIVGLKAVVPTLFYAFLTAVACLFILYIARLFRRAAVTLTGSRRKPVAPATSVASWRRIWQSLRPSTAAEAFFVACFLATLAAIVLVGPPWNALIGVDTAILGCSNLPQLRVYQPALTAVIAALTFGWIRIFAPGRRRRTANVGVPRWGSAGLILLLTLAMTMPWRLLWEGDTERVRIGGDRGYIIRETASHFVVHNAASRTSIAYHKTADAGLTRLGIYGYLFEEPAAFESGRPACSSIALPQ